MESIDNFLNRKLKSKKVKKENKHYINTLWHATSIENVLKVLENDHLKPYTKHRYWEDGKVRKDNDPQYEDSRWKNGWSLTRNKLYALSWNTVVLEFDREKINQNFKIEPLCWGYLISQIKRTNYKRELEDFVLSGGSRESINYYKELNEKNIEEYDNLSDKKYSDAGLTKAEEERLNHFENTKFGWMSLWEQPDGRNLSLSKNCLGIYLNKENVEENDFKSESIIKIMSHPLFKGFLSGTGKHSLTFNDQLPDTPVVQEQKPKKIFKP